MTKQKDRQENKDDQKKPDSEQYVEESWKTLNVTTVFCKFVLLMYIFFERRRRVATLGIVVAPYSNFPGNIYQSHTPYSLCAQFFKAKIF